MFNQQSPFGSFCRELSDALHLDYDNTDNDFIISYLVSDNPYNTTNDIVEWLSYLNQENHLSVDIAPLSSLRNWNFDESSGNLMHSNKSFFGIKGLQCRTNWGDVREWDQPIICQPEIGILGLISKNINGILYFLLQAKIEPGNVNGYQLSPTVQATRSNYNQVHGGKPTTYLDYFKNNYKKIILVDQLQSEQGTRFYKKRNRNIIIKVENDTLNEIEPNYCWLTLRQINSLLLLDNVINMDARSVISSIDLIPNNLTSTKEINISQISRIIKDNISISSSQLEICVDFIHSSHPNSITYHPYKELLVELTKHKFDYYKRTTLIPLNKVNSWSYNNGNISHNTNKYFSVIGVRVTAERREVSFWDQPIIKQEYSGTSGFLKKIINGSSHVLVHYKMECGFIDSFEVAPTVQCVAENYFADKLPVYYKYFIDENNFFKIFDTYQSEEGGRFYQESNRNIIMLVDSSFPVDEQYGYYWMTISQLKTLINYTNLINIEARSLISCMGAF
jgi:dTDP-4-dehydro-6-deoxy-alpha-D-glucopyranose 2,3-dehydratase